jgi:hypothetical protein
VTVRKKSEQASFSRRFFEESDKSGGGGHLFSEPSPEKETVNFEVEFEKVMERFVENKITRT